MKIVTCNQCGKKIHAAEKCFHCGGTDFSESDYVTDVPQDAAADYEKLEKLLAQRKFEDAYILAQNLRRWMDNSAEVYWIRLLAKKECATDLELVLHGAELESEEDYQNAAKYAEPEEYRVYLEVQDKIERMRMALSEALRQNYLEKKQSLHPADRLKELEAEIQTRQENLARHYNRLVETEAEIRRLDADARLAFAGVNQDLRRAGLEAKNGAEEIRKASTCTESQRQKHMIRLTAALQLSEEAAATVRAMKENHPWMADYQKLAATRDEAKAQFETELQALKDRQKQISRCLEELQKASENRRNELYRVRRGYFGNARDILADAWEQVLRDAEVFV